ncbi:MAG: hypothetical protein R3C44_06955 [Chloroflexota bacterium]
MTGEELLALVRDNALRLGRPGMPRTERGFIQFSRHLRHKIDPGDSRWGNRTHHILIRG